MNLGRKLALLTGAFFAVGCQIFTLIKVVERLADNTKHSLLEYLCLVLIMYSFHKIEMAFSVELKKTLTSEKN
jgi:hypothetical protein